MSRKILISVLLSTACTGLNLGGGNAYPCDYALGPGVRDEACFSGDVCGVDNVCKKYLYEGPRFEGAATVPTYGPGTSEGVLLHPLVLDEPVTFVTREQEFDGPLRSTWVRTPTQFLELNAIGGLLEDPVIPPMAPSTVSDKTVRSAQPFSAGNLKLVLTHWRSGEVSVSRANTALPGVLGKEDVLGFRVIPRAAAGGLPVVWTETELGILDEGTIPPFQFEARFIDSGVRDVAGLVIDERGGREAWMLALTRSELLITQRDGGAFVEAARFSSAGSAPNLPPDRLKTDRAGRIVAAVRRTPNGDVLSTFQVTLDDDGPVLTRSWPDCRPCGGRRIEVFSPSVGSGRAEVELLCLSGQLEPLRVVGSVALTSDEGCINEPLDVPLTGARLMRVDGGMEFQNRQVLVQWDTQAGVTLGGRRGEVWAGDTISRLAPAFLDRIPTDVDTLVLPNGERSMVTVTDDYLAVQQTPSFVLPGEQPNGFRRVPVGNPLQEQDVGIAAFVHQGQGWGLSTFGQLGRASRGAVGLDVEGGPLLVTAGLELVRETIGGEAYVAPDGGVQGLFVAAGDSLYFVPTPENYVVEEGDEPVLWTPDLTPEPSVPIRSLALERTPLGTNGLDAARGYLVTSRSVYEWKLGGSPPQWSARPLVLTAGEPLEVWFDSPRSALGRVGFADGQVFTLPGGYQLVESLPEDEEGTPAQAIDFENLGGWPVVYATTGIFVAGWDVGPNGKLQNRFPDGGINRPMSWRELTLPDGSRPWMDEARQETRPGRLYVTTDPKDGELTPHRLILFLEDRVFQVATHLRK
jgi:hypothetical protein